MPVDVKLQPAILELVDVLMRGEFERLELDGRIGRLTAAELSRALSEYGGKLVPLPDDAFDSADCYPIEGEASKWAVDLPLWTREEGRSDLTLALSIKEDNGKVLVEIDDLHVL
ncbi:DUF7668 domain-containing protein [Pelagibius marinus]|uniref:DUF7668 domain-containing protein n=1 Tax=Pelagibius marinus TaxID=2762760 RepID=UPI00187322EC|nr:hypothetical protein [Pelagibius marinus]